MPESESNRTEAPRRVASIDATRALVMLAMIFVNDLAGVPKAIVPWWLRHFKGDGNGMTFVDLVFPGFLFIVGMSIPLALGGRRDRGEPAWKTAFHVVGRTLSLLLIGILMVNETPDTARMGWSGDLWCVLMYSAAILAFWIPTASKEVPGMEPTRKPLANRLAKLSRFAGFAMLAFLAFVFVGGDGHRIIALSPFSIHTEWYGILGLIAWAYLVGASVWMAFGNNRTALLGSAVLLMCLYPAERLGAFEGFWLGHYIGIGSTLGSLPAITVLGILLGSILVTPDTTEHPRRIRFTLLFMAACAADALLAYRLYGINKNSGTPSWCLWACVTTAAVWLVFYITCDVRKADRLAALAVMAGANVLLPYLLSEMLPSLLTVLHLAPGYDAFGARGLAWGILRSAACAVSIMAAGVWLTRKGLRLKL